MGFIEHWHSWLIIAFIVLAVELMTGTYFLLAAAGGALLTSALTGWLSPNTNTQLATFAITTMVSYFFLLLYRKKKGIENSDGTTHMLGQQVEVVEAIAHTGRVRYKGVLWKAVATECISAKAYAEIVAVHGSTLTVKPTK